MTETDYFELIKTVMFDGVLSECAFGRWGINRTSDTFRDKGRTSRLH